MPDKIEIKLTATTQEGKWHGSRRMWNWSVDFDGRKFNDGGKPALESDIAWIGADAKVQQLLRAEENDRQAKRKAEQKAKAMADYRIPEFG